MNLSHTVKVVGSVVLSAVMAGRGPDVVLSVGAGRKYDACDCICTK